MKHFTNFLTILEKPLCLVALFYIIILCCNCTNFENDMNLTNITGNIDQGLYGTWECNITTISFNENRDYNLSRYGSNYIDGGIYFPVTEDSLLLEYRPFPEYQDVSEHVHYEILSIDSLLFDGVVFVRKL